MHQCATSDGGGWVDEDEPTMCPGTVHVKKITPDYVVEHLPIRSKVGYEYGEHSSKSGSREQPISKYWHLLQ